jgi:hypothetical protein
MEARYYRKLPLSVNGILQAFAGLKMEAHGIASEDLKTVKHYPGPHPMHAELITRCIKENRFDLLEKASKIRQGDLMEAAQASLHRIKDILAPDFPKLGQADLFHFFELLDPVGYAAIKPSKASRNRLIKSAGLSGMPQARGYADSALKRAFAALQDT